MLEYRAAAGVLLDRCLEIAQPGMDRVRCLDGIEQLADGGIHFGEAGRKVAVASATRERRTRQGRNVDERKRHVGVERLEERSRLRISSCNGRARLRALYVPLSRLSSGS